MKNKVLKVVIMIVFIISINLLTYATNETEDTTNETTNTTNEVSNNTSSSQNQTQTETNSQSNTSTTSNSNSGRSQNNSSSTTSTQRQTTTQKSSNANLSNLGIRPNDFSGFTPNTTTYNVEVPEDVDTVEVYAQAQDSNATIEGTGEVSLKEGINTITVQVTAEDGTIKTYTLNITRGEAQSETDTAVGTGNGLSKLEISNAELEPEFKTDVYEYTVKYIGEGTSLEITPEVTQEGYTVEILGNEDLKEGENLISIVVTDAEGNNVATYQLIVNKSLVDEEALAREQEQRTKTIIIAVAVAVLVIIAIVAIIIRKRRNRAYAEEYLEPYSGMDDNDNLNSIQEDSNIDLLEEEISQEDDEQKLKEKMRKEFLDNYNLSDENNEYAEATRKRHKGKRFK